MDFLPTRANLVPSLIRPFPAPEVTTRSDREVDPRKVGMTQEEVERIWRSVVRYYEMGLHPAIGICLRRRGEIILDRAIGHASGNGPFDPPGTPLVKATPKTLFNFFSGTKSVTAMLVHLCHERGLLHVDEPVATFIPEFAKNRKHTITIKDVLCHRAGIPNAPTSALELDLLARPDEIMQVIYDMVPVQRVGGSPAYHAITGGFVLAEVIKRVTGKDLNTFLDEEIRKPLGFDCFRFGVPKERLKDVAMEAFTGPMPYGVPKYLIERALGFGMPEIVKIANDERFRLGVVPAGNLHGTPEEICRFYEMLLSGGSMNGKQIFHMRTIARAVEPQVFGEMDRTLFLPVPYSMGFMLGSELFGFYGPQTQKAFGHLGFTNVLGWCDPERDISCALMNSGKPLLSTRFVFWFDIMRNICTVIPRDR